MERCDSVDDSVTCRQSAAYTRQLAGQSSISGKLMVARKLNLNMNQKLWLGHWLVLIATAVRSAADEHLLACHWSTHH